MCVSRDAVSENGPDHVNDEMEIEMVYWFRAFSVASDVVFSHCCLLV